MKAVQYVSRYDLDWFIAAISTYLTKFDLEISENIYSRYRYCDAMRCECDERYATGGNASDINTQQQTHNNAVENSRYSIQL